jgi:ribonuclease HI
VTLAEPASSPEFVIFTDGACSGNPGVGGWAAILVAYDSSGSVIREVEIAGFEPHTTNNRMEIMAAVAGLRRLTRPTRVRVVSDSTYLVYTMTRGWNRKANQDLWAELDLAARGHRITWQYVRGHAGHAYNERCDRLAVAQIAACKAQRS